MSQTRSVLLITVVAGVAGAGINLSGLTLGPIKPYPDTPTVIERIVAAPAEAAAAVVVIAVLTLAARWVVGGPQVPEDSDT